MQGWLVSFVIVIGMSLVNAAIGLYGTYKTEEVKYAIVMILSIIIGAFQIGFIINALLYIWPIISGR